MNNVLLPEDTIYLEKNTPFANDLVCFVSFLQKMARFQEILWHIFLFTFVVKLYLENINFFVLFILKKYIFLVFMV